GATTFWEDFDLSWLDNCYRIDEMPQEGKKDVHGDYGAFCYLSYRHSLCHGWSAGVIPYLVETVAGIKPQGAGMRRIVIEPNLSGLKKVKVKYPTPYGILEVKHTVKGGKVYTSVISPKDVEVEIKNK
ncbi:MAG: alpha-L-rhamnosidase, partial [Clostridia bacterium]|nr:alpha-L-rhamnosidase [Clostridia bacterium]